MPSELRYDKTKNGYCTYSGFPRLEQGISCVDASSIALGAMLAQPRIGDIENPLSFASRKLSTT
jgi:hypothetical protein